MKFLFLTDTHIRTNSMRSRMDSIADTLETKLKEVNFLAKKYAVDAVLHGGDLFDRPDVTVMTVSRFAKILSELSCPLYAVAGNHDMYAHNPKTLPRTMLGLLDALGVLQLIPEEGIVLHGDCQVQLSAAPFRYDIDRGEREAYYVKRQNESVDYHILMVHGMLLKKPFIADISHTVIADLDELDADVVLAGHYHNGFETTFEKNTWFINPGSLLRTSNSTMDMERTPQVVILTLEKGKEINIERVPLVSAQKGDLVLSREVAKDNELRRENLERFKQLIREQVELERYDILNVLQELSKKEQVEQDVVDEALARLADLKETQDEED